MTQHNQRCETCGYKGAKGVDLIGKSSGAHHQIWCRKNLGWVVVDTIALVGCASYSSSVAFKQDQQSDKKSDQGYKKWDSIV